MCKLRTSYRPWFRGGFAVPAACLFICMVQLLAAGAFAQNSRTPTPRAPSAPIYAVDGLALGARVDAAGPAYRGYQCSPSEQFPDLTRCQRTQRQQDPASRRVFEVTSSSLQDRDGKALYINRYIAPWSFDRNEIEAELKQLSSKFGERAREMRLPPREGIQTAVIAAWGKIELTQLDADALAILASGESPRKGLLVDYLGNLRRSAQLGLPVYSISGGAGYLWSASVDRNNRGHVRVLAVDPAAVSPPTAAERPVGELTKTETGAAEKLSADAAEPAPVEPEKTSVEAGATTPEVKEVAAAEADQLEPSLARLEADLAAAQAKRRQMERLAYWALGGAIALLLALLLVWRRKASATRLRVSASPTEPASTASRAQSPKAEGATVQSKLPDGQSSAPDSTGAAAAGPIQLPTAIQQKQDIAAEKRDGRAADTRTEEAKPTAAEMTACAQCHQEINVGDKFCMHCGASVAAKEPAATTRLCSSCRQEIGGSDRFCRHCGASSKAVAAPSLSSETA